MTSFATISSELFDPLTGNSLPVSWPGINFDPPPTGAYLEVKLFRSPTERLTIKGRHRISGFLQVTVSVPEGEGSIGADEIADTVSSLYPVDARFGNARITKEPSVNSGFHEDGRWKVPITIDYEAFT